jgi:hypothetical protein
MIYNSSRTFFLRLLGLVSSFFFVARQLVGFVLTLSHFVERLGSNCLGIDCTWSEWVVFFFLTILGVYESLAWVRSLDLPINFGLDLE